MVQRTWGPLRVAIAQLPITGDVDHNVKEIKSAMHEAANGHARLIQFPEGMLTGYAKHPIMDWGQVDWRAVADGLAEIMQLAKRLNIWVVVGSAHPLTPPHWPHNSLYIISDKGELVSRYDKRIISHTEVTGFYTPGSKPIVFDVDGYRFGCLICIEVNFPELFAEYTRLGVDCILLSAFPEAEIFYLKARAHAAIQCCWVSLSTPTDTTHLMNSALIGPDGEAVNAIEAPQGIMFAELNRHDPQYDIALNKAKPWRASVWTDRRYDMRTFKDSRSSDRTTV